MAKKQQVDEFTSVKADLNSFDYDVPVDILQKIEKQLKLEKESQQISVSTLTKELMAVAPERKNVMILSVVTAMIAEVFNFASYFFGAYAAMWIMDYVGGGNPARESLFKYAALAMASVIVYLILSAVSTNLSHQTAFAILAKLRVSLFEKLAKIPLGYMIENPVGKIKVTISEKVAELEDWVAHIMPELPSKLLHPLLGTIILFVIDWRIGLSLLAPVPLIFIGMSLMMNKYRARGLVWACSYENVADRSTEYIKGIPVIKAFLQEEKSYQHFADAVNFYFHSTMDWWRVSWVSMAIVTAAASSPLIATLPVALSLYSKGAISTFQLILTLVLAIGIIPQLISMMMGMDVFMLASNAWLVISELLNMPEQKRPDANDVKDVDQNQGIEFKDVNFSYKSGVQVLNKVNFKTNKNEMTALVGASGSGKSTIAKLICSYWDVDSGDIMLSGINIKDISFNQLMAEISYVSQDNYLFDTSIKENIKLAKSDATDEEIIAAAKRAMCHDFISAMPNGYDSIVGEGGSGLSGGEKQRISIARALLKDANIVLLDEATSSVDPENEYEIMTAINELCQGKTVISIAHRLSTVKSADQILVISDGKLVQTGKHDELIARAGIYQNFIKAREKAVEWEL